MTGVAIVCGRCGFSIQQTIGVVIQYVIGGG